MKDYLKRTLALFCIVFVAVEVYSENYYWVMYTHRGQFNDNWQWNTRFGYRQNDNIQTDVRWGISPTLKGNYERLSWMLASRFFYYDQQSSNNYIETRPWIGLDYKLSAQIKQQLKWEHRMYSDDKESVSRIRYCFNWSTALFSHNGRSLQLGFAPEAFWCVNEVQEIEPNAVRWIVPLIYTSKKALQVQFSPFLQTTGFDFNSENYLLALRLNVKSF